MLINYSCNIDPAKNVKASEDFLLITLHAHVIGAAKKVLSECQFNSVQDLAKEIVMRYVFFDPNVTVHLRKWQEICI